MFWNDIVIKGLRRTCNGSGGRWHLTAKASAVLEKNIHIYWSPNIKIITLRVLASVTIQTEAFEASNALAQNYCLLYNTHLFKLQTLLCILVWFIHLISLDIVISQIFVCLANFTFICTGFVLWHIFCECSCCMIELTQFIIQPGKRQFTVWNSIVNL